MKSPATSRKTKSAQPRSHDAVGGLRPMDCERYQTTMVKRNKVMTALGARLTPGCHVVWLDQVLPMYRKDQFCLDAVIGMVKSTNHRFRVVTVFKRQNDKSGHSRE